MGWDSEEGAAHACLAALLPAPTLGGSPECLAGDLHMALESSLDAAHPSLTCHCQEMGRGWAGCRRGLVVPRQPRISPFLYRAENSAKSLS